jgi:C4-dicarboxylate-specific signal transduction histidine kinase
MSEQMHNRLKARDLAFFGKITAGVSHEINNVIAIINELSGLLNDLLFGAEQGRRLDLEKLKNISDNIDKQVSRGEDLIKRLNRFAHSVDEPVATFDASEVLDNLIQISLRFAALKRVELKTELPAEPFSITGNPFYFQQATSSCIEMALAAAEKNGVVVISLEKEQNGAAVSVTGPSFNHNEDFDDKLSRVSGLMEELGGRVELCAIDKKKDGLTLHFPSAASLIE